MWVCDEGGAKGIGRKQARFWIRYLGQPIFGNLWGRSIFGPLIALRRGARLR